MIFYTLLPKEKIKILKRDYRIRIFITLIMFVSIVIIIGVLSLFPSYIISLTQEKSLINKVDKIEKDQTSTGMDKIISELNSDYLFVKSLKNDKTKISFLFSVERVLSHRNNGISLTYFEVASSSDETAMLQLIVRGQSSSRDSLLNFKKNIESDDSFSGVELPISDLAKSKNIPFSIRLTIKN